MKSVLALLFSFTLFAQNPYPDTLVLTNGKVFPCIITSMNSSQVSFNYLNRKNETIIYQAIDKLSIEEFGTVFTANEGLILYNDKLEEFLDKRSQKIKEAEAIEIALSKEEIGEPNNELFETTAQNKIRLSNRWSFGVLYIPYYSGIFYQIVQYSSYPYYYQPEVYGTSNNETNMEVQLTYALSNETRITFDAGYTSTYLEERNENHTRSNDGIYNSDGGDLSKQGLTMFNFNLGVKYHLENIVSEKVSVFALAGIGKQFAFAEKENKNLFPSPTETTRTEDNEEEFMEDANSPFTFNIGFGAEYFFNESLSLVSNIRFIYSRIEAEYDSRTISNSQTYTTSIDYKKSKVITRIGLGLNFYF